MKLENFKGKKFEAISPDAMSFILGGYHVASGGGSAGGFNYSNDYQSSDGVRHVAEGPGNDWSHTLMKRFCGDNYNMPGGGGGDGQPVDDPLPGDEIYDEWINHISIYDPQP